MPVELLYLWGGMCVVVALAFVLLRYMRRRKPSLPPTATEGQTNGRFPHWTTRLQLWLLSPPGTEQTAPDLPPDGPEPQTAVSPLPNEFTLSQMRFPAAALLFGGSLIALIGLAIRTGLPPAERARLWGVMGIGGLAFVLAGRLVNQRRLPRWMLRPAVGAARFLDVSAGQLVLLALAPCFALLASLSAGELLAARHGAVATAAWLLAGGLAVSGSWRRSESGRLRVGRGELVFVAALLVAAFVLRGTNLAGMPTTLSGDEAASGLTALAFRNGEADNLFTFGWFSFPSLYFPIQSLGIRLLGQTTEGLRITSAVGGTLAVAAGYWLARALFDRLTAVLTAVYLAASHYHIHMSRIGLNNVWDSFFGALAIMGLWHGWKTGQRRSFILSGVALGLGQYFYVSIRALPLIFLVWASVAFWRERAAFRKRLPGLALVAAIAFVLILPLGIQAVRHWDNFMAPYGRVSIYANNWLEQEMARSGETALQIITGQMLTTALGFTHQSLRLLYNPGAPLLLGGAAALFLIGVFWTVTHFDLKYLLIILPLLMVAVAGGFSHNPPASQRYIMALPLVVLMMVLPLRLAVDWLQQLWPRARPAILLGAGLVLAAVVGNDLNYYFFEVYDSYVLGGGNTEAATQIAYYLRDHNSPEQQVYFFGFPRMGYYSLATIQYLAPRMQGKDIADPITAPPDWSLDGLTLFIFLPERLNEMALVRQSYPDGRYRAFSTGGVLLFAAYEITPAATGD